VQQERNLEALRRCDGSIFVRGEDSLLEEAGEPVTPSLTAWAGSGDAEPDTGRRCRGASRGDSRDPRRRSEPPIEVWAASHAKGDEALARGVGNPRRRTSPTPFRTRSSSRPDEARTSTPPGLAARVDTGYRTKGTQSCTNRAQRLDEVVPVPWRRGASSNGTESHGNGQRASSERYPARSRMAGRPRGHQARVSVTEASASATSRP